MLIYKKATPQELQKYRDDQVKSWKKEKDLQRLNESQVNQMLDLFLLFASQRTFTIRTKDVEAQNTLLRVNEESTLFSNVLSKMNLVDEDLNFIDFLKLYLQCIGEAQQEEKIKELFTTLSAKGAINLEDLKRLAQELDHYHLKEEDLNEIMKVVSGNGQEITEEDFIRFYTQIIIMIKIIYRFSTQQINYYTILELNATCTQKQIKQNYLKLAKIYHPDVYKGNDANRFKLIQEAYNTLKTPEKRQSYDQTIFKERAFANQERPQSSESEENTQKNEYTAKQTKDGINFTFTKKEYKDATEEKTVEDEFRKFMQEPLKINPEEVKVYENVVARQMTKEHKAQDEFIIAKENKWKIFFFKAHQIGYSQQVKEYIKGINQQWQEKKNDTEEMKQQKRQMQKRIANGIFFIFIGLSLPFFYSALARRQEIDKDFKEDLDFLYKVADQMDYLEISTRFVY
ncbi:unnamed protein product (macronuclear) [Paramecium tetraurelia]|uniref:J domain-containing protein n=1 Tax=Paramecium tetraurelia TaxID=5888 RepID=A0DI16_PARTE|nr:uncharacterized protein GSPATT00017054001 [Paramecium tetraurelia]CAK82683.1 unnamed protein product [Paramecium tetraurelia]|eukprot:XP_001450080.1 hypothetical protein (macronuclear) [Paramecium tetraurelia strain d4-2]